MLSIVGVLVVLLGGWKAGIDAKWLAGIGMLAIGIRVAFSMYQP